MKRRYSLFLLSFTLLAAVLLPLTVHADMGPKPSVRVHFENLSGEVCYGTLLSQESRTGPHSVWDGNEDHIYGVRDDDMEIWRAFAGYQDTDGFYFLGQMWKVGTDGELVWSYFPPQTFKVLLYYPESGRFAVSGKCERYAFDSYFTIDMAGERMSMAVPDGSDSLPTVRRSYPLGKEILLLSVRFLLTVAVEIAVALLFGIRGKKPLLFLLAVNAVTQVLLNLSLNLFNVRPSDLLYCLVYFLLELAVFALEAVLYCYLLRRLTDKPRRNRYYILYALVANAASFCIGLLISPMLPSVF